MHKFEPYFLQELSKYLRHDLRRPMNRLGYDMITQLHLGRNMSGDDNIMSIVTNILDENLMGYAINSGDAVQNVTDRREYIMKKTYEDHIHQLMKFLDTWIRIAKDQLKFQDILGIRDIEQRMTALKRYGVEKLLHDAKATLIQKTKRGNELFIIPKESKLFSVDAYYLKYSCPSTGRLYISGVPPEMGITNDADACMAWKHGLSTTAYQLMSAES